MGEVSVHTLREVDLDIRSVDLLVLLGPSGSWLWGCPGRHAGAGAVMMQKVHFDAAFMQRVLISPGLHPLH